MKIDMVRKRIRFGRMLILLPVLVTCLSAQFAVRYEINEKIEAEDLTMERISDTQWLTVGNGIGWVFHPDSVVVDTPNYDGAWYPSEFIYSRCGNRHWLCDERVIEMCTDHCADEYVSAEINIPEDGYYVIYAYVANWPDSANIDDSRRTCFHSSKYEASSWFIAWDDIGYLDKVQDAYGEWNVLKEYIWHAYPYDEYCGHFNLDTVWVGYARGDGCGPFDDPNGCDFPTHQFPLTAGTHTVYFKVAEEFTLLDWIMVSRVSDPPPAAEPGRPYETVEIYHEPLSGPTDFSLSQNFPNPFNSYTFIEYTLPWRAVVNVSVYDLTGNLVRELVNGPRMPGKHWLDFDAGGLASGIYFYSVTGRCLGCDSGELFTQTRKMLYLK